MHHKRKKTFQKKFKKNIKKT